MGIFVYSSQVNSLYYILQTKGLLYQMNIYLKKILKNDRFLCTCLAVFISIAVILTSDYVFNEKDMSYNIEKARILEVDNREMSEDPFVNNLYVGRQYLNVEILTGKHKGIQRNIASSISRYYNYYAKEDMTMLFWIREENNRIIDMGMYGYSRDGFIISFVGIFFAILILIGRAKGLYSVISLVFTLIMVIFFTIPHILNGSNPVIMAIITSIITTIISIILISGYNKKSLSAIIGVIAGVTIAGVVGYFAGQIANLSGINMPEAEEMMLLARESNIQVKEVLFAGIIIASLGAMMDTGMSIASSVFELHSVNNKLTFKELYKSGMNIGRDTMGTMSNTLILAFAGGSISILIMLVLYDFPYIRLMNLDILGLEVIQGISGSIGLIFAVPITAFVSAFFITKTPKK